MDGVSIYYEVHGSGTPLLMGHGFSLSSAMWQPHVEALAARHSLILVDHRGHGRSDSPSDLAAYSTEILVADEVQLLAALGIEQAIIGGLSLGGGIAVNFALRHPEMTLGLILCDTGSGSDDHAAWVRQCREGAAQLRREGIEPMVRQREAAPNMQALRERHPEVYEARLAALRRQNPIGLANAMEGVQATRATIYELGDLLPHLRVPTLIVVGAEDAACRRPSEFLHQRIAGAELAVIPGCGHGTANWAPEAWREAVVGFLSRRFGSTSPAD